MTMHHKEISQSKITEQLRRAGIHPYHSEESLKYEDRLIRAISRLYLRARKSSNSLEELGVSTREGAMAEETQDLMTHHYDQPLEFFTHFLDSQFMAYSMAYFGPSPEAAQTSPRTLEQAQQSKFEAMCERARIQGDERVFNIGCGFGSLETYLLRRYPRMQAVGITPSKVQSEYLKQRMKNPQDPLGQGRFHLVEGDFSEIPLSELGANSYDVVFSIGTLEHFKNMRAAFQRMSQLLKTNGRAFHHIVSSRYLIPRYSDAKRTRLGEYFPGARIFPFSELAEQTEHFELEGSWFINGMNYWRTLEEWHKRFWANMETVYLPLLGEPGVHFWNDYFCLAKAMFAPLEGDILGNAQYYFTKKSL